jgi:hypothetical protein
MDDAFCAGVFRFVCSMPNAEVFDDYPLAIKWLVRRSVTQHDEAELPQPENAGRYQPNEQPKQIRA